MQNQISGEQIATTNTTVSSVDPTGQPEPIPDPDVPKSLLADLIVRVKKQSTALHFSEPVQCPVKRNRDQFWNTRLGIHATLPLSWANLMDMIAQIGLLFHSGQ